MKPEFVMKLRVEAGEPLSAGRAPKGELTIIPITGGMFEGTCLRGKALPGGAGERALEVGIWRIGTAGTGGAR
ncbi:MAG: DUF3237 family protein [Bacillota bacterium]